MVEKFSKILDAIVHEHGDVQMFAILQMDEYIDKWTVILSAPWIKDGNKASIFEEIRKLLVENLTTEESSTIARIGIFPKEEHLVAELLKFNSGSKIEEQAKINGNLVYKAHILASNPALGVSASAAD